MKLEDVYYSINEEIFKFQYEHNGKMPDCIFMSEPLIEYIKAREILMCDYGEKKVCTFYGINVKTYDYSQPQYYLAEGPKMFKKYCKDTETIYTED